MSKNISIDEVKKLASLSQISLTDEEVKRMADEMDRILDYVKQLETVDTAGLKPTSQVTGLENVTRKDELIDYHVTRKDLLNTTPDTQDKYIKTKRIL